MQRAILAGPLLPTILRLSAPVVAANVMETAYEWADMFWLGRVGPDAQAAVTVGFPAMFLLISIAIGFTIAGTTLVAQYTGAGDQAGVNRVAGQTTLLLAALALVLTVAGYLSAPSILRLLGTPPEIMDSALVYLRVFYLGLLPMFFFFTFSSLLRGWGDTVTPMKLSAISVTLNIVLDPLLIFGIGPFPELGVAGAAYATVFARSFASLLALYLVVRGRFGIRINRAALVPDWSLLRRIFRLGLPASVETGARSLEVAMMTWLVAGFGATALAAYGIGGRIMSLVFLAAIAISTAATTMVGQNIGARQPERAAASGWQAAGLVFVVFVVFTVFVMVWPQAFIGLFNKEAELVAIGSQFLRIVGATFAILGAGIVLTGALRGAGDTTMAMVFSLLSGWVIRLPIAWLFAFTLGWGLVGIWWAMAFTHLMGLVMAGGWFKLGRWRRELPEVG